MLLHSKINSLRNYARCMYS